MFAKTSPVFAAELQQVARDVDIRHKPVSANGPTAIAPSAPPPRAAEHTFDVDAT